MPRRLPAALIVLAALALGGCSIDAEPAGRIVAAAPTTNAGPNAGLLTGTQLKAVLVPASSLPSGFAIDAAGTRDTGDTYAPPLEVHGGPVDCTRLGATSWLPGLTGTSGVSFAQNDYVNPDTSSEIAQEVEVYRGTTAQETLAGLDAAVRGCRTFTDAQTSSRVTVKGRTAPGLADGGYVISLTDPQWVDGMTLVAERVGTAIVTVLVSSGGPDDGKALATSLAGKLAAALAGKA